MAEMTPMQETKGDPTKKNKLKRLLKLSASAIMSHPFGSQLTSWEKGVVADYGDEWSKEAINLAMARGPHPTAAAPNCGASQQGKAGFKEVIFWDEIKNDLLARFKMLPAAVTPEKGRQTRMILDLSFPVRHPPQKGKKL
jgi:hypothetical protein